MRSPIGPILVVLGLGTTLLVVLLLFQSIGMREDLERAREDVAALQARVEAQEPSVTRDELRQEIEDLRTLVEEALLAGGGPAATTGDVGTPAGGTVTYADVVERLDEVMARITALDQRVDQICGNVPVC